MTPHERARQIDQEEFRRDSEHALARALEYSRQKRREEHARLMGITIPEVTSPQPGIHVRNYGRKPKLYEYQGRSMSARAWAVHLGVDVNTIYLRIRLFGIATAIQMGGTIPREKRATYRRGAVFNLGAFEGTGAGAVLQENPNLSFSDKATDA